MIANAGLINFRGFILALAGALVLCWPIYVTQSVFYFSDTSSYIRGGEIIWNLVLGMFSAPETAVHGAGAGGAAGEAAGMADSSGSPFFVRSFVYSLATFIIVSIVGTLAVPVFQGVVVLFTLFALYSPDQLLSRPIMIAGAVYLAVLTTLPWFTVYLMPDIFAAVVVIYGAILMRRYDEMSWPQRVVLTVIAALAIATHYGYPPVAAGLFVLVLIYRALRRRITAAVLFGALFPLLFSPVANLTASSVALDTTSPAPLRLPILLARSLQDGPARWYLSEECPEADLAFCEAFGDTEFLMLEDFLWSDEGINSLTPELMARIRDEEIKVLYLSFRAYPVEQTISFFGNVGETLILAGTGAIFPAQTLDENFDPVDQDTQVTAAKLLEVFDTIIPLATWTGVLPLFWLMVTGRLSRRQYEIAFAVLAGLLLNALVFGGLSAPAERYQSRVIWLLPALSVWFMAEYVSIRKTAGIGKGAAGQSSPRRGNS